MISSDVTGVDSSSVLSSTGSGLFGKIRHNKYHATQVTMQRVRGSPKQMLNTIFQTTGSCAKCDKDCYSQAWLEAVHREGFRGVFLAHLCSGKERTNCSSLFVFNRKKVCAKLVNLAEGKQNTSSKLTEKLICQKTN